MIMSESFNSYDYYKIIAPDIKGIKSSLAAVERQITRINMEEDIPLMKSRIIVLINDIEKLALRGREIPLYLEREEYECSAEIRDFLEVSRVGNVTMLQIPLLLPRSRLNRVNKGYLVSMFHEAFQTHFRASESGKYKEPVVFWFEYQYRKRQGKQGVRDHDNVESKVVKDLLVPYVVVDDSPSYCDDFHSSRIGEFDATFIHIVPRREFGRYYESRVSNGDIS